MDEPRPERAPDTVEAMVALADRIEREDRSIRAFVAEPDRRGRIVAEATGLVTRRSSSPLPALHGVPIGVKDIVGVDGLVTAAGSEVPAACFEGPQATLVTRLRDAGAIVLGKTETTEFAFSEPAPTSNPLDPTRTPGGSSSGSAAAVAAGFVPLAVGTQTVDSVITPAAYCGVVGFKPSYGRIPIDGVIAFSPAMDHAGLLAADVATAGAAAAVVCDGWRDRVERGELVFGLPAAPYLERATPTGRRSFDAVLPRLTGHGCRVVPTGVLADIGTIARRHRRLVAAEFAAVHAEWFDRFGDLYRPRTAGLVAEGRALPPSVVEEGIERSRTLNADLQRSANESGITAWLAPAATGPAPVGLDMIGDPIMSVPWTHAHLPAVTLPVAPLAGEMPTGLQLVGRLGHDEELLAVAAVVERLLA